MTYIKKSQKRRQKTYVDRKLMEEKKRKNKRKQIKLKETKERRERKWMNEWMNER